MFFAGTSFALSGLHGFLCSSTQGVALGLSKRGIAPDAGLSALGCRAARGCFLWNIVQPFREWL